MTRDSIDFTNPNVVHLMEQPKETLVEMLVEKREEYLLEKSLAEWLDRLADSLRDDADQEDDQYDLYLKEKKDIKERYNNYYTKK